MGSRVRILVAASLVVWASAVARHASAVADAVQPFTVANTLGQAKKTTNDGVYTKEQADGAKAQYDKICAECHAFTVAAKKKPKDKPLGEDPFFEEWTGRPLSELVSLIHLTMPDDGSADVSEEEATSLVAYILQQNGFAAGATPLSKDSTAIIERPIKK
jgi:mono/diheme cytochrome c family protein